MAAGIARGVRSAYAPGCAALIVLGVLAIQVGFRINTSASMPIGVWRIIPSPEQFERGTAVLYCMGDEPITWIALERHYLGPGVCPSGVEPMLKTIVAVVGDTVLIMSDGMIVNGILQPNSVPMKEDPAGRIIPAWIMSAPYRVDPGEVWLLSNRTPMSFDSRYFGAVSTRDIIAAAEPVLVW